MSLHLHLSLKRILARSRVVIYYIYIQYTIIIMHETKQIWNCIKSLYRVICNEIFALAGTSPNA